MANDTLNFPLGSWEASLTAQLNFSLFIAIIFLSFFVSLFWSYSNCAMFARWFEQTEEKGW